MYVRWKTRTLGGFQSFHKDKNFTRIDRKIFTFAKYEYAYLVESFRDKNGKVRQKYIAYLGSTSKPLHLCKRTNSVIENLPGLGKRKKMEILKSICHRCKSIKINNDILFFDL